MVGLLRLAALLFLLVITTEAGQAANDPLASGKTLLDQDCAMRSHYAEPIDPQLPQLLDITCGPAKTPSGSLQITPWRGEPGPPEILHETIQKGIKESSFTIASAMRLACFPGKWLSLDGNELLVANCTSRDSGWPAISVAAWRDKHLMQGEGPVAVFPLLRDYIANQHHDLTPETKAELLGHLEAALGDRLVLQDAGDMASFRALCEAARLQDTLGSYSEAEDDYRQALALQRAALGPSAAALGDTMMHLALEVSNQGRTDEARDLFKAAEPLIQSSVDPIDDARLVSYLALDAANRHSFAEARDLAHRATEARRALTTGGENAAPTSGRRGNRAVINGYLARGEMVQSELVEAAMSLRLDQLGIAAQAAAEALEITQTTPGLPNWWRAEALSMMGEIEGKLGHRERGEAMLRDAIAAYQRFFGDARPTALAWLGMGRFHVDQGQYEVALEDFRRGLSIISKLRRNESVVSFDAVSVYFTTAIDLAEHDPARHDLMLAELFVVLQTVQKGKESGIASRSFERLASSDAKVAELLRDLQDAERTRDQARLQLAGEEAKPPASRDGEHMRWLAQQYRTATEMVARLDQGLRENVAEYRRVNNPGLASLKDLQAALEPGEVFVTFAFGEEFGLVFAVSQTTVEAHAIPQSSGWVADQVRELREGIIVRSGRVGRYDLKLANELYRTLLLPVEATLHDAAHLVVSASGPLASLPLGALVTKVPKNDNPAEAAWLIQRSDISQMPSAAAFLALRRQVAPSKATRPFLGIGNPRFSGSESGMSAILSRCGSGQPMAADILAKLPALPDTATEIRNVAAALGAGPEDILLGTDATEGNFRARPLGQYRVVYFATHGLLPAELRCQSEPALALTPPAEPTQSKELDGLLEASEIAGLRLDADLVVLSACNTATAGGKFGGDTLASLSDMFFYAGSRAVLATHWPVPSASTSLLMSGLFKIHQGDPGAGYAAALRQSQLALLGNPTTAHPVHWAGFSLIGGANHAGSDVPPTVAKGG
jgi:CHAT domain-containing protein